MIAEVLGTNILESSVFSDFHVGCVDTSDQSGEILTSEANWQNKRVFLIIGDRDLGVWNHKCAKNIVIQRVVRK